MYSGLHASCCSLPKSMSTSFNTGVKLIQTTLENITKFILHKYRIGQSYHDFWNKLYVSACTYLCVCACECWCVPVCECESVLALGARARRHVGWFYVLLHVWGYAGVPAHSGTHENKVPKMEGCLNMAGVSEETMAHEVCIEITNAVMLVIKTDHMRDVWCMM